MAVDEQLAARIRSILQDKQLTVVEKRMFGGIAFMVNGNMMVGIMNDGKFMARVGKDQNDQALRKPHASQMHFRRPMIGYITVEPKGVTTDSALAEWIEMSWAFNQTLPKQ